MVAGSACLRLPGGRAGSLRRLSQDRTHHERARALRRLCRVLLRVPAQLRSGKNRLLVDARHILKVCTSPWGKCVALLLVIEAWWRPDCVTTGAVRVVHAANDSSEKPARGHNTRTPPPQTVPTVPHVGDAYSVTGGGGPGRFRLPPGCRPGRPYWCLSRRPSVSVNA